MPYRREDIDRAIREAAEAMGEPLTRDADREYRDREGDESSLPSFSTIIRPPKSYETWRAACDVNDVESGATRTASVSTADRVAALRGAAAELGEPLSETAYGEWQRDRDAPALGHGGATTPPGIRGWADWCLLAGVEPARRGPWSPLECLYALRLADRAVEGELTADRYAAWRDTRPGVYPDERVLTTHWPSFAAARTIALGDRDDVPPEAWDD